MSSKAFLEPEASFFNRLKKFLFEVGDIELMNYILKHQPSSFFQGPKYFGRYNISLPPVPNTTTCSCRLVLKGLTRSDICTDTVRLLKSFALKNTFYYEKKIKRNVVVFVQLSLTLIFTSNVSFPHKVYFQLINNYLHEV